MSRELRADAGAGGSNLADLPRTLAVAASFWLAMGVIFVIAGLGGFAEIATGVSGGDPIGLVIAPGALAVGAGFLILRRQLRRGRDTRIPLTVLAVVLALAAMFVVPVLFIVIAVVSAPAIVLQYRASSNEWFAAMRTTARAR